MKKPFKIFEIFTINVVTAPKSSNVFCYGCQIISTKHPIISCYNITGGGRVVRRCWVNFQCQGVLLTWITVGQGLIVLAVGAGGGCLDIFSLIYHFSFLTPSLWETARYRLKYCLKGPLSPKQPTNQLQHNSLCPSTEGKRDISLLVRILLASA